MKKTRSLFLALVMSSLLAGNIFATGSFVSAGGVSTTLFAYALEQVVLLFSRDSCPTRQCTNCRPNNVVDENGNCRPREN